MLHFADVLVPPNEEGTRATVLRWCKAVGDTVVKDEPLVELETDKVTVEIPAPADGTQIGASAKLQTAGKIDGAGFNPRRHFEQEVKHER